MKNVKSAKLKLGAVLALLAILFTVAVRTVDVSAIGPEGTAVGFSHVNQAAAEAVGVHLAWYVVTGVLGAQALLLAGVFALCGLIQLIRRRSLWKVDGELLALACLYAVTFGVYVFFEVVIVNYRPVILPGDLSPEASFPSSHTMLSCVVLGSAMVLSGRYIPRPRTRTVVRILCGILMAAVILGRIYSGVHWLTDICGGLLYGVALLFLFAGALDALPGRAAGGRFSQGGKCLSAGKAKNASGAEKTKSVAGAEKAKNAAGAGKKHSGSKQSGRQRKKKKR